ncbi:hypothetical protein [Reyranella soli]|uniref:Uncharacterized protein n=1 Tax=Reyranella soli TaxID=1230389 RepID=A0A512NEH2_9HYPH|nr:hypothetical protein [Reyranella soli]GEP57336.1 hypothetical protein RSO01_45020 [Reyranella soli]
MADIRLRAPLIRDGVRAAGVTNFAEALAQVFEDASITDDQGTSSPLAARLKNVLQTSADSFLPRMSHFSGIFADWTDNSGNGRRGDNGFKAYFQDFPKWPGSSMQVGHFMTAVDMGFQPSKLYNFVEGQKRLMLQPFYPGFRLPPLPDADSTTQPNWWTFGEVECVQLIVAHEQVPDSGVYGQEPTFWNMLTTLLAGVTQTDLDNFRKAFVGLGGGPQHDAGQASVLLSGVNVGTGPGNSREDLLLSLFGFKFGSMVRKGELSAIADGGNWIRVNLVDQTFTPITTAPGTAWA